MSSCFSRCLRVPIAIRAFYESYLWILQTLSLTHPDLHPGLLGIRERARNSFSISSGSGTKTTRSSAQIRSHRLQASAIDFVSTPVICSLVRSLRTVICVNLPKRNCCCPACSNQDLALWECICRLERSASQTLASRKFNVFINLLIRQRLVAPG